MIILDRVSPIRSQVFINLYPSSEEGNGKWRCMWEAITIGFRQLSIWLESQTQKNTWLISMSAIDQQCNSWRPCMHLKLIGECSLSLATKWVFDFNKRIEVCFLILFTIDVPPFRRNRMMLIWSLESTTFYNSSTIIMVYNKNLKLYIYACRVKLYSLIKYM